MIINPYVYAAAFSCTDSDGQAFITAAGITDSTQQSAVCQLVKDLKSANIWTKMKALYPIVGGTSSTHKWNLKDPRDLDAAFRLNFALGMSHSSTGMTPNGTSAYADTFFIPSSNVAQNSQSYGFYSRTNRADSTAISFGARQTSPATITTTMQLRNTNNITSFVNSSVSTNVANTDTTGFYQITRTGASAGSIVKNSTATSHTLSSTGNNSYSVYIGARNNIGLASLYDTCECAFFYIADGLTNTEAALLYQITEKYQVTLGRNINPTQSFYYNGSYDNDTNVFLFNAQITNTTQQSAVNTLVTDLKSANIWTKMRAIYPVLGGTASTHKWNLKDPRDLDAAFRLNFSLGWTHSSNGMTPSNAFADTFLIPANILTTNSNHFSVYTRTNQTTNAVPLGSYTDGNRLNQFNISTGSGLGYYTGPLTTEVLSSLTDSKGFFIGTTRANNDRKTFRNGVQQQSLTTLVGTNYSIFKMYLGARNVSGGAGSYTTQQIAFASIGDGLTDTEAANFYTAVNTYQTTLGRNV